MRSEAAEAPVRRGADSRARLLAAARVLFADQGYHATRPQDIARHAGLGHGTFYLHFADKRACFLAFVDEARDELDRLVRARIGTDRDLEHVVRAMLDAVFAYAEANPGVLIAAMMDEDVLGPEDADGEAPRVSLVERWGAAWAAILAEEAALGQAAGDLDPAIIGCAIVGAIHQGALAGGRCCSPAGETVSQLTRFIVRGLSPGRGPRG